MKSSSTFRRTSGILSAIAISMAAHSSLNAATVVSNATGITTSQTTYIEGPTFATSFTTGSGPGWTLDSVEMLIGREPGANFNTALNVKFETDGGGVPAVAISVLGRSPAPLPTTPTVPDVSLFTYTPQTPVTLAPNTTYWISAETAGLTSPNRIAWAYTTDFSETGETGWSIGDSRYVLNGSWSEFDSANPAAFRFAVNATPVAVPEPSVALISGFGMASLLLLRRRQRA